MTTKFWTGRGENLRYIDVGKRYIDVGKWVPSSLASLRLSGRAGFPVCSNGSSKYTRTLPVSLGVV